MKRANGFTLIELLVTVVIIGILATVAITNFSEYRKRTLDVRATNVLRNLILSTEALKVDYMEDHPIWSDHWNCSFYGGLTEYHCIGGVNLNNYGLVADSVILSNVGRGSSYPKGSYEARAEACSVDGTEFLGIRSFFYDSSTGITEDNLGFINCFAG